MNKRVKKLILSLMVVSITCLPFVGGNTSIKAATNSVTVNLTAKDQVIRGFGASSAWCGAINDTCMDALYKNIGLNILRVRIAPNDGWNRGNYSAWADELSNAKKAEARGAIVFATPWTPPASMKTNNSTVGTNGASLKPSSYGDYANYLKTFVNYFASNGVPLYALSIQNEPDWPASYDGCVWTAQQLHDFIKGYGATLSKSARIIMPESLGFNHALSDSTLNDPATAPYVSIIGGHLYGATIQDYPLARSKGKEIWMTEHYFEGENISTCMNMAKEINDCMTVGNMSAYVNWWIFSNDNGLYNPQTGVTSKRADILGQYSKFIGAGYNRVDATANPQTSVYASAYTGNNKVVIVAINQGTSNVNQSFNIPNAKVSKVASWMTSSTANMVESNANINVVNGSFTAALPAQSITTFVGNLQ